MHRIGTRGIVVGLLGAAAGTFLLAAAAVVADVTLGQIGATAGLATSRLMDAVAGGATDNPVWPLGLIAALALLAVASSMLLRRIGSGTSREIAVVTLSLAGLMVLNITVAAFAQVLQAGDLAETGVGVWSIVSLLMMGLVVASLFTGALGMATGVRILREPAIRGDTAQRGDESRFQV